MPSQRTELEDWVHANVRRIIDMPPSGDKSLYSKDKWPNYDPEEAPNGYVEDPESRKVLWRPNWENLRNAFFGNLVDVAVKACEDDRKSLKLECPSTEETRDRVVAYLKNIAKRKCGKQSKKEADEKRILGRTRTVSVSGSRKTGGHSLSANAARRLMTLCRR